MFYKKKYCPVNLTYNTTKNSLRNLTRTTFHGGFFELEILEIFITAILLKAIVLRTAECSP